MPEFSKKRAKADHSLLEEHWLSLPDKQYTIMKRVLFLFSALMLSMGSTAQSLAVHAMDTVLEVNSTGVADYGFSVDIENVSSAEIDVYAKRAYHEMNCAYDSGYFCWDYCYGNDIDNSIGALTIQPGSVRTDFSGHVFSPSTGSVCMDSTRYVFYNGKDNNDSLSVWVYISAGPTVGTIELSVVPETVYPNPAVTTLFVEVQKAGTLRMYNALGANVLNASLVQGKNALRVEELPNGIYLYSIDGSSFKRITVSH